MNIWHDVSPDRVKPEKFLSCIEISKNSKNKYELDKETGLIILDRVLYTSTHYPANYGFIPLTLAGDGDPLDVLVLCQVELLPLSLVRSIPIGVIKMIDSEEIDEKIIAVAENDPSINHYRDVSELPPHIFHEISHFFGVYKQLEGKKTEVQEVLGRTAALQIIEESLKAYQDAFPTKK